VKEFFKNNGLYFGLYLATLLLAAYFLLTYDKFIIHEMINHWVGNSFANTFYKYFTHVGDGMFAVVLSIIILFFSIKKGMYVLLTYACAGISASLIKYFANFVRPFHFYVYYKKHLKLNLVDGVEMLGERSFPSGHAVTAFAVFTALALITENKMAKVVFFIIAVNAAFSRMYLSQHWLFDIFIGSLIGTFFAILLYFVFYKTSKFDIKLNIFKPN
jgi:membrane-associated phospholipid phosphatase